MEKIKSVCTLHYLTKAVVELQNNIQQQFGITMNEAVVLCCIGQAEATAGEIAAGIGMTASATSKVIRTVEGKSLITRRCGDIDHRCMKFRLSEKGLALLQRLKAEELTVPWFIAPLFADCR